MLLLEAQTIQFIQGLHNIDIKGNGNIVSSGVKNVQLINSNNQTVTQSNIVYVNDEIQGTGSFETVSADFLPSENIKNIFSRYSRG